MDFYLDHAVREDVASYVFRLKFRTRSAWLLGLFAAFTLLFFSLSTNQEYYTWPAWIPLIMLTASMLAGIEQAGEDRRSGSMRTGAPGAGWVITAHVLFALVGLAAAVTLGWGLWQSRELPFVSDIGTVLAHRAVGDYSLSMSHFFDLTGPSFAALRLPAALAAGALLIGPLAGLLLRLTRRNVAATGKRRPYGRSISYCRAHCVCAL